MCQYGRLLVNSGRSGKSFNITNMGVPRTCILLDIHSTINIFCKRELLTDVVNIEEATPIHCNVVVVWTYLSGVIPGFYQETTWYHLQEIANTIYIYSARKNFQITYNIQDGNVFCLQKLNGSYNEFRES